MKIMERFVRIVHIRTSLIRSETHCFTVSHENFSVYVYLGMHG